MPPGSQVTYLASPPKGEQPAAAEHRLQPDGSLWMVARGAQIRLNEEPGNFDSWSKQRPDHQWLWLHGSGLG